MVTENAQTNKLFATVTQTQKANSSSFFANSTGIIVNYCATVQVSLLTTVPQYRYHC